MPRGKKNAPPVEQQPEGQPVNAAPPQGPPQASQVEHVVITQCANFPSGLSLQQAQAALAQWGAEAGAVLQALQNRGWVFMAGHGLWFLTRDEGGVPCYVSHKPPVLPGQAPPAPAPQTQAPQAAQAKDAKADDDLPWDGKFNEEVLTKLDALIELMTRLVGKTVPAPAPQPAAPPPSQNYGGAPAQSAPQNYGGGPMPQPAAPSSQPWNTAQPPGYGPQGGQPAQPTPGTQYGYGPQGAAPPQNPAGPYGAPQPGAQTWGQPAPQNPQQNGGPPPAWGNQGGWQPG